ncbi:SDR family oxidoreductase [Cryptosporangium phraense]|uniref:SDR family oxidoreductase n=1 Tax=Cryptosporangium phraense TaxID=2593070 RepID=A0A545AXI4_9ACTN|nr:SDR family oxidoreductase [Cryptosporangium phraense]TQS46034.1 SDR family oxidoreductase [Cryptosporangium phraense]
MATIEGAVALVTGGQRGLGKAFVEELLAAGAAKVYATARTPVDPTDPRVVALPLDVTDPASIAALAERIGDVTLVFNNAGTTIRGRLIDASRDDLDEVFATNVFGVVGVSQAVAPILAGNGGGALVNVASVLSWVAGAGVYGASKAALWSVTNTLRVELAGQNTQVVGVHLGYTDTDMTRALDVPKNDPRQVARDTIAAVAAGETEVLADEVSRVFKAALSGPVEGLALTR